MHIFTLKTYLTTAGIEVSFQTVAAETAAEGQTDVEVEIVF